MASYYNGLRLCSYNAVINLIRIVRNTGKTWNFEYRQWRRAVKHGKCTLWLRTFKKEAKAVTKKLYHSKDLQKKCGIIPYDTETKKGNFKQEGNTFYCKRGKKWIPFLEVYAVSDANTLRSADNVDIDTIIYDECDATIDRQHRYVGNVVQDFIDIFISIKREHKVTCFLLCNKESIRNPFFAYFNLPTLPSSFEGIRTFKNGSIALEQSNTKEITKTDYNDKVDALLNNTAYGRFLKGAYKNSVSLKLHKTPFNAWLYAQLEINGYKLRISGLDGNYYVSNNIDPLRRVYVLKRVNKYKNEILLLNRFKRDFINLSNALADNKVYYDNETTYEAISPFYEWLGI